jgi:hypothetical protein
MGLMDRIFKLSNIVRVSRKNIIHLFDQNKQGWSPLYTYTIFHWSVFPVSRGNKAVSEKIVPCGCANDFECSI